MSKYKHKHKIYIPRIFGSDRLLDDSRKTTANTEIKSSSGLSFAQGGQAIWERVVSQLDWQFRNFLSRHTLFPELNKLPLCLLNSSKSLLNADMKQHFQIMLNEQQKFDTFNEIWADFIILDCSRLFQKPYRWVFFLSSCLHQ